LRADAAGRGTATLGADDLLDVLDPLAKHLDRRSTG
jgi:hypothetical protein